MLEVIESNHKNRVYQILVIGQLSLFQTFNFRILLVCLFSYNYAHFHKTMLIFMQFIANIITHLEIL